MTDKPPPEDPDDWGSPTPWQDQPPPEQPAGQPPPPQGPAYPPHGRPQPHPPPIHPLHGGAMPPPNFLIPSILVTVLCCLPTGIVAIVYATQVNGKLGAGDFAGAKKASDNAKLWTLISVGLGVITLIVFVMIGAMAPAEAAPVNAGR